MSLVSPTVLLFGVLALLLVSAGIQDARTREIANWKNAAIALLAPFWWWVHGLQLWPDIAVQVGVAAIIFGLFCMAFARGWMGGGDVKMIGALALWFPFGSFAWLLIVMSLIGGVLTVILMVEQKILKKQGNLEIPYGVAIAIAALFAMREPIINQFT